MVINQKQEKTTENKTELMENEAATLVSVEKIIEFKQGSGFFKVPKFVVRIIEKVVKQKEINDYLGKNYHLKGIDFFNKALKDFNVNVEVTGKENIPEQGRFIFVCNHPLGAMDAFILFTVIGEKFRKVKAIVNDILMLFGNLNEHFVPVNVFGQSSKQYITKLNELFDSEEQILIFPAGEVSRIRSGKIADNVWQKAFVSKAIAHQRDVIPIYMEAKNSRKFYKIAQWRSRMGIKANIELILLPREMFTQENKTIKITIGKKIPFQSFTNEFTHQEWAQKIRTDVYDLAK